MAGNAEKTDSEPTGDNAGESSSNSYQNDGSFLETFRKEIFKQRMENYKRQWGAKVTPKTTSKSSTKPVTVKVEPTESIKEPEVPYYTTQTMCYKEGASASDGSKTTKTPYQVTYLLSSPVIPLHPH